MATNLINTSGAGALIIDAALARAWTGFYWRADVSDDNPDLETENGDRWRIDDTFDFAKPKTDYDRLCRRHQEREAGVLLNELHGGAFVSMSDGSDSFCWWPELSLCTGNPSFDPPTVDWLARLSLTRLGSIVLASGRAWLMNPCLHGAELGERTDQAFAIDLPPGRYDVDYCERHDNADNVLCVRLTRG
jgi:hypothetical protein